MHPEDTGRGNATDRDAAETARALADELRHSAAVLRSLADRLAARRIALETAPEQTYCPAGQRFTRLEWIEFTSAVEFARFKYAPPIAGAELAAVDLDALTEALQQA